MKNKVFAIALAFCMILTMMPGTAWAETPEQGAESQLYAVWLKPDAEVPENRTVAVDQLDGWTDVLDIELGYARVVQYFACRQGEDYVILEEAPQGDSLVFDRTEDGRWKITPESIDAERTGEIRVTQDDTTYAMDYELRLPGIGAYKTPSLDAKALLPGETLSYDDLGEETDGMKTLYFVVNTTDHVGGIELTGDFSEENIKAAAFHKARWSGDGKRITPAYLEVQVSKNVLREEFEVHADVSGTDWSDVWNQWFCITGNLMYRIFADENSQLQVGDTIRTEDRDDRIWLTPSEQETVFLGIPTEEPDVYQIAAAEAPAPELSIKYSSRNAACALQANEHAEIGTRYFLQAAAGEKTYKIPVDYDLPGIGVYREPESTEASYLGTADLYRKVKDTRIFYILARNPEAELRIENRPDDLDLTEGRTEQEKGGFPYYKVEITDEFQEGEVWVVAESEESGSEEIQFWLSREDGADETAGLGDTSLLICIKKGNAYEPIPLKTSAYGGQEEAAQFYVGEHPDRTFYVLLDTESELKGELKLLKLNHYRASLDQEETEVSIEKLTGSEETCQYGEKNYRVWKIKVLDSFQGASRVGFHFGDEFASYQLDENIEPRTKFMWILDEDYEEPSFSSGNDGNIIPCDGLPQEASYADLNELLEEVGELGTKEDVWGTKCLNLSKPLRDEDNAIYLLHPAGTRLHGKSARINSYEIDGSGSGRGDHFGGWFQQKQEDEIFTYVSVPGEITVDGRAMQMTKAYLTKTCGHQDVDTIFYLTDENGVKLQGCAAVYLQKGMDIVIKGTTEDVVTIDSEYNIVSEAVGGTSFDNMLEFTKNQEEYRAFYANACAQFSDEGSGRFIGFNVKLEPGYVIEGITDKEGDPLAFTSERVFFYSPLDADGNEIYSEAGIRELGWYNGISGAGNKHVIGTYHCVASSMQPYMEGYKRAELGNENISAFVDFLLADNTAEAKLKAKMKAAYTNYTVYFDPEKDDRQNEIVFHVAKAEIGDEVAAMRDKEIHCRLKQIADSGAVTNLKIGLEALGYGDYDVLKVYEINAEASDGGLYNVTIPESELKEGADLSEYYVVYYKDGEEIPYVMETTYVEGKGIVFTTGHFSNYAIIYKPNADPTPDPTPTPDPIPGGGVLPGSGDVTTGDADNEKTEADKIEQAKAGIKKLEIKARSSKTKNGVKVILQTGEEGKAFAASMQELGYTVKYRFYRSTKKSSGYKAMLTKTKPVYVNTTGRKGMKYFYRAQIRVYDEKGTLVAATALKQCRYACRSWIK